MISVETLKGTFDLHLLALSVFIAFLAVYAGIDLAGRIVNDHGRSRWSWLAGGGLALGIGLWSVHYTTMESFRLPIPVVYDWPTVLLSLVAAIFAAGCGLFVVSRSVSTPLRTLAGTLTVAIGILTMQYLGVKAMRLHATYSYNPSGVLLFLFVACAGSYIGIRYILGLRDSHVSWSWRKLAGILVVSSLLPAMTYIGMASLRFAPSASFGGRLDHVIGSADLNSANVAIVAMIVLGLAFLSSIVDRRFTVQTQKLIQSQAQLQAIFDNMQEGIVVIALDQSLVQVNHAAEKLFDLDGDAKSYADLRSVYELLQPDGNPLPPTRWPSYLALQGQFVQEYEVHARKKRDGSMMVVEISSAPIFSGSGELVQVIISYRDVTRNRQVDLARARLAAIVEYSEDAIIGKNSEGIVTSWNRGAQKLFGYTADEIVGQSVRRLIPPDLENEEDIILAQISLGETVEHIETVRRRKDGQLIDVSLTISPIRDPSGKIVGASKIARDITERRQMERQLRQSQKMETIGQLSGGIAHDFNNLLGVILGNLDLLANLVSGNQPALKRVQTAQKAVSHGADLTRRMLMFSRKEDLRPRSISLDESISNVIELAGRGLGPEIRLTAHLDPGVPRVFVDVAGLESALLNLIVNARDAMPKGGSITIATELSKLQDNYPPVLTGELRSGPYACVTVSDTGHGMTREVMDRIFEPFFTTKSRNKGTGLGLAMVYGFVKQSGGTVRVYSEPGYGTTISFYLPLASAAFDSAQPSPEQVAAVQRGGTVLVVDDEEDLLEIAVAYLRDMGFSTLQATNGSAALAMLASHPVDLVITDIIMPGGMNGVELVQKLRETRPGIRFIYCSGFPADALAERNLPMIDGPLLRKPYHRSEFGNMVRNIMNDQPNQPFAQPHVQL
jgi:PAS domain S-box-containing protein